MAATHVHRNVIIAKTVKQLKVKRRAKITATTLTTIARLWKSYKIPLPIVFIFCFSSHPLIFKLCINCNICVELNMKCITESKSTMEERLTFDLSCIFQTRFRLLELNERQFLNPKYYMNDVFGGSLRQMQNTADNFLSLMDLKTNHWLELLNGF